MTRLKLFDNDGDSSDKNTSDIKIDSEFAKRYEHNKKRDDLKRYEELKKQGVVDSLSSDPEESSSREEELIKSSKKIDAEFFDALIKVKNKDPILREKDAKLFDSDAGDSGTDEDNASEKKKKKQKQKQMYSKDISSQHLIETGAKFK